MTQQGLNRVRLGCIAVIAALALSGCSDDDDGDSSTATPTVTATRTSTRTPTSPPATVSATPSRTATQVAGAQVAGLIVVDQNVGSGERDNLSPLPPETLPPVGKGFDRGLGNADWVVDGGDAARHHDRRRPLLDHRADARPPPDAASPRPSTATCWSSSCRSSSATTARRGRRRGVVGAGARHLGHTPQAGDAMRAVFAPNGSSLITRGGQRGRARRRFAHPGRRRRRRPLRSADRACEEIYACDENGGCGSPERICVCIAELPGLRGLPASAPACRARYFRSHRMCGPDGLCKRLPYACGDGQSCAIPGDECTSISSCFGCDNCVDAPPACRRAEPGEPIDIDRIEVFAPRPAGGRPGRRPPARRRTFSDGTAIDVTWLATWASSQPSVASVDTWGRIDRARRRRDRHHRRARRGRSAPRIASRWSSARRCSASIVQNAQLLLLPGRRPRRSARLPRPDGSDAFLPPPFCQQVVRIGATIQFIALGEFDTGYFEDITDEVEWRARPGGGRHGWRAGSSPPTRPGETAAHRGAWRASRATRQTITRRHRGDHRRRCPSTPATGPIRYIDGGPVRPELDAPCFECGYFLTLLRGDTLQLLRPRRTTTPANGRTSPPASPGGAATPRSRPSTPPACSPPSAPARRRSTRRWTTSPAPRSPPAWSTRRRCSRCTPTRTARTGRSASGDAAVFHAVGYYDVGFSRDVTDEVTWRTSDDAVGGFDTPGIFTGRGAGSVTVWAELDGQQSESAVAARSLRHQRARLLRPGQRQPRHLVGRLQPRHAGVRLRQLHAARRRRAALHGHRDAAAGRHLRSLPRPLRLQRRHAGAHHPRGRLRRPFVAPAAPDRDEAVLKYQLKAFWDLKDESGATVPPGTYTIRGLFYLYYDPVVEIDVTVNEPAG